MQYLEKCRAVPSAECVCHCDTVCVTKSYHDSRNDTAVALGVHSHRGQPGFHRVNDAVDERICKIVHDSGDHNGADLMAKPVTAAVEAELSQVITGNKRITIPECEATQFWSRQDSIRALGTSMILSFHRRNPHWK